MATIQGVYVALFGRPADPTGLAFFNVATNNGANLSAIGDLAATAEYQDKYKGQNNVQIVTAIYQQLFNRNPEATGLNFFVDALNKGTLNVNNIAIAILDGAQGTDKTIVDAKVASANLFTAAIDTPVEDASYRGLDAAAAARNWIATIGATAATQAQAEAALKVVVDTNFVGNTVTLTAGASVVSSDAATLAFADKVTTAKNDTIVGGTDWDGAADTIDGGLGIDTLTATLSGPATAVGVDKLKNIEVVKFTSAAAATAIDMTEAKQVTEVWNAGSGVAANVLTVSGLALSTTVGLTGSSAGMTTFTFADTTGTSDVVNVALNAATGAGGLTINGVETFKFSVTGASNIGAVAGDSVKAIEVSGTGNVALDVSGLAKLATYTGGENGDYVTTDVAGLTVNQAINTGAGADLITIGAGAGAGFSLTLTGGAGADKFAFAAQANVAAGTPADLEANFAKSLITIADFNKAEDVIQLTGTRDALDNFELGDIAGQTSLFAAVNKAASYTTGGSTSVFVYGNDTYVFQNDATATFGAGDGLVKITGLTNLADLTATNFVGLV
ncbi:DUF4214 domain-containing protein [Devosia sp. FJ2-5-3]|uniref:DUF4214 domain-containing protein n=1 Tax=Devosia sp. FJ2-5-3 TaxID=2976680 RepID=UPI0023D7F0CE|nr:DUF4214 domain-containing protein [Devosia sp. FJ2-5-3]WEJ60246.1 DUF4214 domain-containing protein [Devosia sp. FJ2-5-3]